jgi:hypothetical protein
MPWTGAFIDRLALDGTAKEARYLLESIAPVSGKAFGGDLRLSTHTEPGYAALIAREGHSVSWGELSPRSWTMTRGAVTIALNLSGAADIRPYTRRGQLVQLRVGFRGWSAGEYQPVWVGRVRSLSYEAGRWRLQIEELPGALATRWTGTAGEQALFHDLASTTTTGTIGAGHVTVPVVDTTGFRNDGSGTGAIVVTANNGSQYIDTYTGTTAASFTGCDDAVYGTGTLEQPDDITLAALKLLAVKGYPLNAYRPQLALAATTTGAGSTVGEVALIRDHPISAVLKILASTGGATNGAFDVLPASWGFGLPQGFIDTDDAAWFESESNPTGADEWDVHAIEAIENPGAWMEGWLSPAGFYIVQRQGALSIRCARLPWRSQTPGHLVITPANTVRIESYEAWAMETPDEATTSYAVDGSGTAGTGQTEDLVALPGGGTVEHGPLTMCHTNQANWLTEVENRLCPWDLRTAERVVITMAGWAAATSAPGDSAVLVTDILPGDRMGRAWSGSRRGLITSVQPAIFGATTRVVVLFLPLDEDESS